MTQENAADRQEAQQAREQEKRQADESSTAVSPDTQFSDPDQVGDELSHDDLVGKGQSTVFDDPPKPRHSSDVDQGPSGYDNPRPPGTADEDRNPEQAEYFGKHRAENADQDAEPPTSGYGEEQEQVTSQDDATAQTSYGEDQDAAPPDAPYQQP